MQSATLLGIAAAMKERGMIEKLCGRIRFCAVPAEELIEIEYRTELRNEGVIRYMGGKTEFLYRGYFDGVDMAFMIHLENGSFSNYTPVYPGDMTHPTQPASSALGGGKMFLHDSLYDGVDKGMQYAKEIVEANTNMTADAVVLVYDEGVDNVINSIRPLTVDGEVTNLSATDIIRENDAYNGYSGSENVQGTMSRGDAVDTAMNSGTFNPIAIPTNILMGNIKFIFV
jgi:hypothetical protein